MDGNDQQALGKTLKAKSQGWQGSVPVCPCPVFPPTAGRRLVVWSGGQEGRDGLEVMAEEKAPWKGAGSAAWEAC